MTDHDKMQWISYGSVALIIAVLVAAVVALAWCFFGATSLIVLALVVIGFLIWRLT
tara:strand:- start:550 stop:717 length:168 start_codon:yes stop_codon:yes gene_type:complete